MGPRHMVFRLSIPLYHRMFPLSPPMIRQVWHLENFSTKSFWNFYDFYWAKGNLPLLANLLWPIQAHAATRALIPYYNVPDPQTDEEDAIITKHTRKIAP